MGYRGREGRNCVVRRPEEERLITWNEHFTSAALLLVLSAVLLPTRGTIESFYRRSRDAVVPSTTGRGHSVTREGLRAFFRMAFAVVLGLAALEVLLGFLSPDSTCLGRR